MKKVLKGTLIVILLIIGSAGLILGKEYIERKRIEHIVKSDEAKQVIEKIIREEDDKALTSEGKIKNYKIDFDKVKRNPMGGINIYLTINDDPDMILHTTLVRGTRGEKYKTGAIVISPKLSKFID